jgi:hypothetical protein
VQISRSFGVSNYALYASSVRNSQSC